MIDSYSNNIFSILDCNVMWLCKPHIRQSPDIFFYRVVEQPSYWPAGVTRYCPHTSDIGGNTHPLKGVGRYLSRLERGVCDHGDMGMNPGHCHNI